jgi:lipopolysaccharide/colanic/teichoic acid biosynthesis glycosyltransferase
MVYSQFVLNMIRRHRILFVGRNRTVQEIARAIADAPWRGYEIQGFVDEEVGDSEFGKRLGSFDALAGLVRKLRPDRIVVGLEERRSSMPVSALLELRYAGLTIEEASLTYEVVNRRVCAPDLNPRQLIFSRDLNPAQNQLSVQRFVSRVLASVLFILGLPVMAVVAAALRLSSKDPVLLRAPRIGQNGVRFQLLRFRKSPGLGSIYRRLHLDAMPELINVMRGEMSLVGPRPESPEAGDEKSRGIALYDYRHNVPPGMTGWAQINMSPQEQAQNALLTLEYDLYYIKHMSQALNAYILMTTLKNRLVWSDQE